MTSPSQQNSVNTELTMDPSSSFETELPYALDEYQMINPYIFAIVEFDNSDGNHRIPIVETFSSQDADYWMHHDIYGNENSLGSAFIDEHTPLKTGSNHLLVNGHSSYSDSRMFTFMLHYADATYFNENPTFKLITDLGIENYSVISFAHYPMQQEIHTSALFLNTQIDAIDIRDYLVEDEPYIVHYRDGNYSASNYISFVTCDQEDKNNRYILFARSEH